MAKAQIFARGQGDGAIRAAGLRESWAGVGVVARGARPPARRRHRRHADRGAVARRPRTGAPRGSCRRPDVVPVPSTCVRPTTSRRSRSWSSSWSHVLMPWRHQQAGGGFGSANRREMGRRMRWSPLSVVTSCGLCRLRDRRALRHSGAHSAAGASSLGALVRVIAETAGAAPGGMVVGGHKLELRGHAVLVDGRVIELPRPDGGAARVGRAAGRVMSRAHWCRGASGDAAVSMRSRWPSRACARPWRGPVRADGVKRGYGYGSTLKKTEMTSDLTLIAVAHGSRRAPAQDTWSDCSRPYGLRGRVGRPGGVPRVGAAVVARRPAVLHRPAVIVPLLLGNGYHIAHDVAGAAAAYRPERLARRPGTDHCSPSAGRSPAEGRR